MTSALDDRGLWDQKADFWDQLHGDQGNRFHQTLISPSVEALLALRPGERVLDIGCGNGVMARRLATLGAEVVAVDFSMALLERARQRGQVTGVPIVYECVDATDEAQLLQWGAGSFDAVVSTMALMDMPTIEPLFRAVAALLKPQGRCVVATMHPAFNSNNPVFVQETGDVQGQLIDQKALKLSAYLQLPPTFGAGAPHEPNPHRYYHRPLHELMAAAFAAGLALNGLQEPAFPPSESATGLNWAGFWQFPPVLTARWIVAPMAVNL
jgi:2-polyprenyl-3-methyl-5-hydroxy-6-metoxy-1,4-benzoquinol methylase